MYLWAGGWGAKEWQGQQHQQCSRRTVVCSSGRSMGRSISSAEGSGSSWRRRRQWLKAPAAVSNVAGRSKGRTRRRRATCSRRNRLRQAGQLKKGAREVEEPHCPAGQWQRLEHRGVGVRSQLAHLSWERNTQTVSNRWKGKGEGVEVYVGGWASWEGMRAGMQGDQRVCRPSASPHPFPTYSHRAPTHPLYSRSPLTSYQQ